MGATFDRIVVVDGSASSRPKLGVDSIWLSVDDRGEQGVPENVSTRREVVERLVALCDAPGRTLIAVDWSLGYPAGSADAFALHGATPREAMWTHLIGHVADDADNANNRHDVASGLNARTAAPGPFWGAPASAAGVHLTTTKRPFVAVGEWRQVERRLRGAGLHPKSCWQLGGAGAVGSQSLLGIPLVAKVLRRSAGPGAVWPFDTGLDVPAADLDVVVAETWPTLFVGSSDLPAHWIRDAAQVDAVARRLRRADRSGELDQWFGPAPDDPETVVVEEGWILGPV